MEFKLDTGKKLAIRRALGVDAVLRPIGPVNAGAINPEFDAMMAELLPIIDKYLPLMERAPELVVAEQKAYITQLQEEIKALNLQLKEKK